MAVARWHSTPVAGTGAINHGQWQSDKWCREADWEEKLLWRAYDGAEALTTCVNKGHHSKEADPNSSLLLNLHWKAITATRCASSWPLLFFSSVLLPSFAAAQSFSKPLMALKNTLWNELSYLGAGVVQNEEWWTLCWSLRYLWNNSQCQKRSWFFFFHLFNSNVK